MSHMEMRRICATLRMPFMAPTHPLVTLLPRNPPQFMVDNLTRCCRLDFFERRPYYANAERLYGSSNFSHFEEQ